jgi:hypothetical protein
MKQIIQKHHIIYKNDEHKQKDLTVDLYKGEHWCITQLQRRKYITKGFIKALKFWILINEDNAIEVKK